MKTNPSKILSILSAAIFASIIAGCGQAVPENPHGDGVTKADPAKAQQRIEETMKNPNFTQTQKDQIIATIKQRNHVQ